VKRCSFSSVRQALFSVLGSKPDGKKKEEEAVGDMVSTISFIQANLQHNMAVSRILSRTAVVKVIDTTLTQGKVVSRGLHYWLEYSRLHLVPWTQNR